MKNDNYHSVLVVQMKNCEALVLGPELAIERVPVKECHYYSNHLMLGTWQKMYVFFKLLKQTAFLYKILCYFD